MTTMEHVIELVRRLDDEKLEALERELVVELGEHVESPTSRHDPLGASIGLDDGIDDEDRPYDPLGKIIDMVGDEYEGPTDVSSDKYRYVADAIEANWARD